MLLPAPETPKRAVIFPAGVSNFALIPNVPIRPEISTLSIYDGLVWRVARRASISDTKSARKARVMEIMVILMAI